MFRVDTRAGVATVTLDRTPVNAINNDWIATFGRHLDELERAGGWSVLHIRSSQKAFCAGADLTQIRSRFEMPDGGDVIVKDTAGFQRLFDRIERLPQVSLAEINGAAMGGGFELALACDLRIAANEAKLGLPEARLGLLPGAGGTQRLTRLVGPGIAARIILACEIVDGATAAALGMVQWSAPLAELPARAAQIATRIAGLPPESLKSAKSCMAAAFDPGRDGFDEELEATRRLLGTPETRRRVQAFLAGQLR